MTISFYLVVGIVLVAALLMVKFFGERNGLNDWRNSGRWLFLTAFAVLGLLSMLTVRKYMYPSDKDIFANSRYHLLEHRGFVVNAPFDLVKGSFPEAYAPQESLWDSKSGIIVLSDSSITISDYYEPFYLLDPAEEFKLVNKSIDVDASEGFVVLHGDDVIYRMEITPDNENKGQYHYVTVSGGGKRDTSTFKRLIKKGYPLCDIIASTPGYVFPDELLQILQGTMLVRERIKVDNVRYGGEQGSADVEGIKLVIMPGQSWYYDYPEVTVGGYKADALTSFRVDLQMKDYLGNGRPYTLFYSGIGRSKTDVYSVSRNEAGCLELRYALPKMQHFSDNSSRVFLTSSVESVIENPKDGGYYYNIFELDDNLYHINAEMNYAVAESTKGFGVEVMDLYSADPSKKITKHAGEEFHLATRSDNVQWIFAVQDLRETNTVGWSFIFTTLFVFIFLVFVRIYLDYALQLKSLSYLELSVYILLLCMATVRLIITWRVSTFVPIEDIAGPVYAAMRNGRSGWTRIIWAYPLILTVWSFIKGPGGEGFLAKIHGRIENMTEMLDEKCLTNKWVNRLLGPRIRVCVVFCIGLVLCLIFSKLIPAFNRLLNIPAPLILYILFELWAVTQDEKRGLDYTAARIVNSLILILYLFTADAGFIIVFMSYLLILHLIVGPLTGAMNSRRKSIPYIVSLVSMIALFMLLRYEGEIMILLFDHIKVISIVTYVLVCLVIVSFVIWFILKEYEEFFSVREHKIMAFSAGAAVLVAVLAATGPLSTMVVEVVDSKAHMKWRAEVQKLDQGETIDDLMLECDFNSSDVTFIMRSAHNQWFINQYYKEGDDMKKYMELQPHSNQGSTYTTQTTDLAITRYVTAEHGHWPPIWMLVFFLVIIATYCFEIRFGDEDGRQDRVLLGAPVLLFTLALLVYLSATNRIVFIGQDFPLLSIQSKVAVIFPVILLLIATLPVMQDRMENERVTDNVMLTRMKRCIPLILLIFYILTVQCIKPLGKDQNETQFDVSSIVQDISAKIQVIDRDFERFQRITEIDTKEPEDTVWNWFKQDASFSGSLKTAMNAESDSLKFFSSLLRYFDAEQVDKDNPDELLHMRKRNGIWHLAVNKKHFFIPSVKAEDEMWRGDVLAARVHREFMLSDIKDENNKMLDSTKQFIPNILPNSVRSRVPNIRIMQFDKKWTPSDQPLLLITAYQARGSKQFYHIESDKGSIKGSPSRNQVATKIEIGDILVLNTNDRHHQAEKVITWKYGMESDRYLAKNIWLNGKSRLFYPIGKDFMWSYQFANMVSSVYSQDESLRDSSVRVSLDYELHKKFTDILSTSNRTRVRTLRQATLSDLMTFAQKPYNRMVNRSNRSSFYYNEIEREVEYKKRMTLDVSVVLEKINRLIASEVRMHPNTPVDASIIRESVYEATERLYEFTAVAIDGNGKIRLMFDHGKKRVVDPNNISHFNKFLSEMYRAGDNSSERDVFGNKALQILPSGPGSSFKPIMYTAVTSNKKLNWESVDVFTDYQSEARYVDQDPSARQTSTRYAYYGGVDLAQKWEKPMSIDSYNALLHNNYLTYSDNLYHSVIVMLGMQSDTDLDRLDVMKHAGTGKLAFPVFSYNGRRMSFDPEVWFKDDHIDVYKGVLNTGLSNNFNLMQSMPQGDLRYSNYFGSDAKFVRLFNEAGNYRSWVYAETGSQNVPDRALSPYIRSGFNQLFLGAAPLEVSPLQMGTMVMRLATLNRAPNITTLSDDPSFKPEYEFFNAPEWSEEEYLSFYKRQVLGQLVNVPKIGTARGLRRHVARWNRMGYHLYAKTGTLNDDRSDKSPDSRMKHLLLIISNQPLESVSSVEELQHVKYYAVYLSYIGINKNEFGNEKFVPMIDAIIDSELFKKYMEEN